jgi:hypothetical protein
VRTVLAAAGQLPEGTVVVPGQPGNRTRGAGRGGGSLRGDPLAGADLAGRHGNH